MWWAWNRRVHLPRAPLISPLAGLRAACSQHGAAREGCPRRGDHGNRWTPSPPLPCGTPIPCWGWPPPGPLRTMSEGNQLHCSRCQCPGLAGRFASGKHPSFVTPNLPALGVLLPLPCVSTNSGMFCHQTRLHATSSTSRNKTKTWRPLPLPASSEMRMKPLLYKETWLCCTCLLTAASDTHPWVPFQPQSAAPGWKTTGWAGLPKPTWCSLRAADGVLLRCRLQADVRHESPAQ